MILNCNACGKKFVVPDSAITSSGRMVQCGSCGNKWKQFPIKKSQNLEIKSKIEKETNQKPKKIKKSKPKKKREISLYSPEYLAKKHGIKINETNIDKKTDKDINKKIGFGFYSSLLIFIVSIIFLSRLLYFTQELIIHQFPFLGFYLDYFFESVRNVFELWKNLVTSY